MAEENSKTSIILHGHFYQPPRENPRTGVIPKQASASPWEDWNERIFHDCYNANCYSRYLNIDGRIVSLTNNYSYISFNFGPTLLHWLDEKHPDVIDLLREADKSSAERLGHGNAMAQAFNHTILPLDRIDDAMLQIDWGIKDFEYHFKRMPEGMWLPECGVNENVIQLLSDAGIKFIVLSPWQCKWIENESGEMINLNSSPAPYQQSYIITGSNGGEINAFFYNSALAEGISFGHMLRDADGLYKSLLDIKRRDQNPSIIHTATDGEIYGHHEPYGDMALAALIKKINEREDFVLDNYGSFLANHPSKRHAELRKGEDGKGTSWSCSHGVSRWYKDCGCHTGGGDNWNQAWRTPLRNGLANLGDKLNEIFDKNINDIFMGQISSLELLKKAGRTYSGEISMTEFISSLHSEYKFDESEDIKLSHLIEGMKNKHFSLTSCGFFFSDISGIEPRQDIKYALSAISMFQPFCNDDLLLPFLSDLRDAKSNIKSEGDGMSLAQEEMKGLPGRVEAALYFYLNRAYASETDFTDRYGKFTLLSYSEKEGNPIIQEQDTLSQETFTFSILSSSSESTSINLYISENSNKSNSIERFRITNNEIPDRILDETLQWIDRAMSEIKFNDLIANALHMKYFSMLVKSSKYTPMKTLILENLGLTLKLIKSLSLHHIHADSHEKLTTLGNMIDFVKKYGRDTDLDAVNTIFSDYLEILAKEIKKHKLDQKRADAVITTLNLSRTHGFEPETKGLQNVVYDYYSNKTHANIDEESARKLYSVLNFQ